MFENEEEERRWKIGNFFLLDEKSSFSLCKNFKLSWFQICIYFASIFFRFADTALQSRPKMPILGLFDQLWPTISFDPDNIQGKYLHIWNQLFEVFVLWKRRFSGN